jgi:hypothetical protein
MKTKQKDSVARARSSESRIGLPIAEPIGDLTLRAITVSSADKPRKRGSRSNGIRLRAVRSLFVKERLSMRNAPAGPPGDEVETRQIGNRRITFLATLLLVAATFAWSGCASYHRFRPTPVEYSGVSREGKDLGDMTDAAVVSYADRVQDILRKRFHISRIARETSSTMQVLLAGAAGISAAFTAGATAVAGMAFGSAVMPQVGGIFDTGARAVAYEQAVAKISVAENAYFKVRAGRSPVVPSNALTVEGALLYEAVNGATDAVELFQAGMLPTLEQMKRANAGELQVRAALRTGETPLE